MKRSASSPRALRTTVPLVVLEAVSLLTFPASVLALAHELTNVAIVASLVVTAASALRTFVTGVAVESVLGSMWRELVDAARRRSVSSLRARSDHDESVAVLMDAMREAAMFHAVVVPHLIALGLGLTGLAIAAFALLGAAWLLAGVTALGIVMGAAALSQARLRPIQQETWRDFVGLSLDMRVLVEASSELRAHGREEDFCRALLGRADAVARGERSVNAWSAAFGLLPASLAVLALAAPVRAGVTWMAAELTAKRVADLGVLGGTGLMLAFAAARTIHHALGSAPHRKTLADFLAQAAPPPSSSSPPPARARGVATAAAPVVPLAQAEVRFEGVSYLHQGASVATPHRVTHTWKPGRGLAVVGDNGAGKSTLALLLLGLLEPSEGGISLDGVPLAALDADAYRARIAYVPQAGFVALGASVAWHLRLFTGNAVPDARIDAALERVGLLRVLEERARTAQKRGEPPRDVLAGELSGGERQRLHLARALLHDAELVVLDEPEAGLDDPGRRLLRALAEELAASRRVLLIAHDPSVVPGSFERLRCERGDPGSPRQAASRSQAAGESAAGGGSVLQDDEAPAP